MPEFVGEPSNHAEFVASAERVRAWPLAFWKNALAQMEVRQAPCGASGDRPCIGHGVLHGWEADAVAPEALQARSCAAVDGM